MTTFYTPTQFEEMAKIIIETFGDNSLPNIDISAIATQYGCDVSEVLFDDEKKDVSGMVYYKDEKYHIDVNQKEPEAQKRFTIAHEFAHVILHGEELKDKGDAYIDYRRSLGYYKNPEDVRKEMQANMLAAALLMPRERFISVYNALNGDIDDVASTFFVSKQAAFVRMESLNIFD